MRLLKVPLRGLAYHKYQNGITILAAAIAIMTSLCISTIIFQLDQSLSNYYQPLANYNIILERKANIVQFIPLNSDINNNTVQSLTKEINAPLFPACFKFIDQTLKSVVPNTLAGFMPDFTKDLVSKYQLRGRFPADGKFEILAGQSVQIPPYNAELGVNLTLFNANFTIVGSIIYDNPIMANFFITTYSTFQALFHLNGTCNGIFFSNSPGIDVKNITAHVDSKYPLLTVLTSGEIDQISSSLLNFSMDWNEILPVFELFVTFSFSFSIFLLNTSKLKKEIHLLSSLGTNNYTIFGFKLLENLFIIILGLLVGFVLALLIYPIFTIIGFIAQAYPVADVMDLYFRTLLEITPIMINGIITVSEEMLSIVLIAMSLPHLTLLRFTSRKK
jgi:hypothetical protein